MATCTLVAATAAIALPLYRTLSTAKVLLLIKRTLFIVPSEMSVILPEYCTRSAAVTTACTPGNTAARLVSIDFIASAIGDARRLRCSHEVPPQPHTVYVLTARQRLPRWSRGAPHS